MVLRSSLALASGRIGGGLNLGVEIQTRRSGVSSIWSFSGGRVSPLAGCAVPRRCEIFASPARGVVKMSAASADNTSVKSVSVRIHGSVQGVFYRNWTVETAKQLGVNGWVRNNKDGSVEAVFSGKPSAVDTFLEKCKEGPPAAKVSSVEATPFKDIVAEGFERRPTIW